MKSKVVISTPFPTARSAAAVLGVPMARVRALVRLVHEMRAGKDGRIPKKLHGRVKAKAKPTRRQRPRR